LVQSVVLRGRGKAPIGAPGQSLQAGAGRRGVGWQLPAWVDDDGVAPMAENRNARRRSNVKPVNRFDTYADARK
jgi:hypothetical protein